MKVKLRRLTYKSRGTSGAPERNHVGLERDYNTFYLQTHYIILPVTSRGIPELLNHCGPVRREGFEGFGGGGVKTPCRWAIRGRTGQRHCGGRVAKDNARRTHPRLRDGTRGGLRGGGGREGGAVETRLFSSLTPLSFFLKWDVPASASLCVKMSNSFSVCVCGTFPAS